MDWPFLGVSLLLIWPLALVIGLQHGLDGGGMAEVLLLLEVTDVVVGLTIGLGGLAGAVWLGLRGRTAQARRLLAEGWVFADPWSDATLAAARKWRLSDHYLIDC